MLLAMNTIAHASPLSAGGPQLDNRRVIAGLIDLLVVLAGALLIGLAAGLSGAEYTNAGPAISAVIAAWALYYYFACESGGGQTLGKRLMKIRVVRVDGRPAGMREVAVRTVLRLVDGLFLYLVGLIVMMVTGERRGRLGDLAAGTMIVSADVVRPALPAVAAPSVAGLRVTLPTRGPPPVAAEVGEPEAAELEAAEPELVELAPASTELDDPVRDVVVEREAEPVVVTTPKTISAIDLVMAEEPEKPA
jgi:uncharacterized RDD family membrane protein YckC